SNINLRTQLCRIIRRAALSPWPRLFQNLRSSRRTELEHSWPGHVLDAWFGHSEKVAKAHYLQIREEDFQRAAQSGAASAAKVGAAPSASTRTNSQDVAQGQEPCEFVRIDSKSRDVMQLSQVDRKGFEPSTS